MDAIVYIVVDTPSCLVRSDHALFTLRIAMEPEVIQLQQDVDGLSKEIDEALRNFEGQLGLFGDVRRLIHLKPASEPRQSSSPLASSNTSNGVNTEGRNEDYMTRRSQMKEHMRAQEQTIRSLLTVDKTDADKTKSSPEGAVVSNDKSECKDACSISI